MTTREIPDPHATDNRPASDSAELPARTGLFMLFSRASRHLALLVAWVALCGSLFFSVVFGWPPCDLCWYQRILMYPLALILAIGILRNDRALHWYVLPFAVPGMLLSLYHYMLIKSTLFPPAPCGEGVPCNVQLLYVRGFLGLFDNNAWAWLDFINIPFLALAAFVLISLLMALSAATQPMPEDEAELEDVEGTEEPGAAAVLTSQRPAQIAVAAIIAGVVAAFVLLERVV